MSIDTEYAALTNKQIKVYLQNKDTNNILVEPTLINNLSTSSYNSDSLSLYIATHKHNSDTEVITTNYRLRTWIDYNVDLSNSNVYTKYQYKFRININAESENVQLKTINFYSVSSQIIEAEYEETNLYKIVASQSLGTDTEKNINYGSTPTTGVYTLNDTASDENPVYFYRGAVTNNNVVFGKYCWKIVRTTSTGGVKLIYNGEYTEDNKCNNTGTASQLADESVFNSNFDEVYYVGYYYDTSDTFETMNNGTALNTTPSDIAKAVNTWYASEDSGMTELTYMLENEKWCNDRTNDGSEYFGASTRVASSSSSVNPSIECPNNNDAFTLKKDKGGVEGYGNNVLDYPVGLLTADEATLAGSGWHGYSSSAYLISGSSWWLASPYTFNGNYTRGFLVYSSGILRYYFVIYSLGVRPAVSLIPGAEIEEGNTGTASDPYVVVLQ